MTPARPLVLGLILTGTAGFIDAIGFVALGGYYTSFMSGNTTQLGVALLDGAGGIVVLTGTLIGLFVLGSTLGTLLVLSSTRWGAAFASGAIAVCVLSALGMSQAGFPVELAMLALAATAGAQNTILPARGAVRLGATFVTGTLHAVGQDLALALRRRAPALRWLQHLGVWLSLMAGAAIGSFAFRFAGMEALTAPIVIYAAFAVGHAIAAYQRLV